MSNSIKINSRPKKKNKLHIDIGKQQIEMQKMLL